MWCGRQITTLSPLLQQRDRGANSPTFHQKGESPNQFDNNKRKHNGYIDLSHVEQSRK